MKRMGNLDPVPTDSNEFGRNLQRVFSTATSRLVEAVELEAMSGGGYIQGFVGGGVISEPTKAFRLRSKTPKIVGDRLIADELVIHVPVGQTGVEFLELFWLERISGSARSTISTILLLDGDGSTPVGADDTLIGLEELVDSPAPSDFETELALIGFGTELEAKIDNLGHIASTIEKDFDLVPFYS